MAESEASVSPPPRTAREVENDRGRTREEEEVSARGANLARGVRREERDRVEVRRTDRRMADEDEDETGRRAELRAVRKDMM